MSRKYWNYIYLIGFLLPVLVYFGQFITVALSDGNAPLFLNGAWSKFVVNCGVFESLLPVSKIACFIIDCDLNEFVSDFPFVTCWTVGADFVIWLSIMHIVIDVFMLLSRCFSKLFNKFGGAD